MTDPARTTTDPATEPTTPSAVVAPPAGTSHRVRDLTVVAVMLVMAKASRARPMAENPSGRTRHAVQGTMRRLRKCEDAPHEMPP